jgi:hypothetical protein
MAAPEPVEGSSAILGVPLYGRDPKGGEDSLSFGSHLRFICDHVFDLLASPTPELPRVSGSLVRRLSHLAVASLQGFLSMRWND